MRGKVTKMKNAMNDSVKAYNLIQPDAPIKLEDVEHGIFTWTSDGARNGNSYCIEKMISNDFVIVIISYF